MSKTYSAPFAFWSSGYVGVVTAAGAQPLNPRHDLNNHSPDGFAWGYGGSGPAQLALALLADATGDDELAGWLYQSFKWQVIAKLDQNNGWELSQGDILKWVKANTEAVEHRRLEQRAEG